MRFLYQVVYSIYSFSLSINGSRTSGVTVIVEDLLKNGCSSRYLISQTKFCYLNFTYEKFLPSHKKITKYQSLWKECLQFTHSFT